MAKKAISLILVSFLLCSPAHAKFGWGSGFDESDLDIKKNALVFSERSENSIAPAEDGIKVFAKDDGGTTKLYTIDFAGTVTALGAGGVGSGDVTSNTSSSVDSEIALFSGTGGKTIKRASQTGVAILTAGVLSAVTKLASSQINWTNITNHEIQRSGINWDDIHLNSSSGINWQTIPGWGLGNVLSVNSTSGVNWHAPAVGGGSGDITAVGDCSTGACFEGTSGTTITASAGNDLNINAGTNGHSIYMNASNANVGSVNSGGSFEMYGGNGDGPGLGGSIALYGGVGGDTDANGGGIYIYAGAGGGAGTQGVVEIDTFNFDITSAGEVWIAGVSGDGTGKVVCVKSDAKLGTCSDQPNGSGVCTCG